MSFDYQLVRCSHCGTTTAHEFEVCRRCGRKLKAKSTGRILMLAVGGAFLVVAAASILMYLTRGTTIGGLLALGIAGLSFVVSTIGYIWLIVAAFQVSGMWGMACIFFPIAQLIFLFKHTDRAIMPFTLSLFSIILLLIASFAIP